MKVCGVYCIRCNVNNKVYIGSSVDIHKRWREHENDIKRGEHPNTQLQEDYYKYGADNFSYIILTKCSPESLRGTETLYIRLYNAMDEDKGYNRSIPESFKKVSSDGTNHNKKIKCVETGEVFSNKKDICHGGRDYTNLNNHLQGKRQSYRGYHWKYVD